MGDGVNPLKNLSFCTRPKPAVILSQNTLPKSIFSTSLCYQGKEFLFFIYVLLFTGALNPFPLYLIKPSHPES